MPLCVQRERGVKKVTVGIAVACKGGVVVGADRKITKSRGTQIKSLDSKIYHLAFKDGRNLLVCGAGGTDLAKRGVEQIDPQHFDRDIDGSTYRDRVESRIAYLSTGLLQRGLQYDAVLLFGMIDVDGSMVKNLYWAFWISRRV